MPDKMKKYPHGHELAALCMHRNKGAFCLSTARNQMEVQQKASGYASKSAKE